MGRRERDLARGKTLASLGGKGKGSRSLRSLDSNPWVNSIHHIKKQVLKDLFFYVVGGKGIEPLLSCENQILSLARLPVPPLAHTLHIIIFSRFML